MSKVYFTSDLHFGHINLIKNLRSMSSEEHDTLIIDNWNKIVTKRDVVYVLGDISMEDPSRVDLISSLNGTIYIIGGNHDNKQCIKMLNNLGILVLGVLSYKGFICTHIPIHESQLPYCRGNIHGHLHLKCDNDGIISKPDDLGIKYFNVNIELHNYSPISFDEIVETIQKRVLCAQSFEAQ